MKKIKAVLQKDLKDCGVASMQWIIMHYDGYISLEKLREDTFTDKNGTNAYHIVNSFQKWGFDSLGIYEKDITSNKLYFPLIAHLVLESGLEHFVVVRKVENNFVYLMDPAKGYLKQSITEFNKSFSGNIILVYPRSNIIKMDRTATISKLFSKILDKEKFLIIKIIITSILWTILLIISSYYLKIGSNLISKDNNILKFFILVFFFITILKILFLFIRDYYLNHLSNLVDIYIYPSFLNHLFYLPLYSIKSRTTGEIVTRVEELASIKSLFSEIFVSLFLDSIMVLLSIIVLYIINSSLFVLIIIFIIIYIILGIIISKLMYKKVLKNIDYQTDFNSSIIEKINMYESIKNLNITKLILKKIEFVLSKLLLNNYEFNTFINKSNLLKDIILEFSIFTINTYGFYLIKNNSLTIIDLFTFNVIISYLIDPIKNVINLLPRYNYIKATYSKLQEFLNIDEEKNSVSNIELKGNIEFKNIYYSYNNYDYIIKNFSFKIKDGDIVMLNGSSGKGKSTICKLLYKELTSYIGEILIDNKNLKDLDLDIVRNNILYISQNEELFTGSIKDNIICYRDIPIEKFNKICEICNINEIINKKGMRYNSLITPTTNISGGEKQRIILARGLLKEANIIILDEALSEVDFKSEDNILKNIILYFKNKTIIYISHKNQNNVIKKIINIGENNE